MGARCGAGLTGATDRGGGRRLHAGRHPPAPHGPAAPARGGEPLERLPAFLEAGRNRAVRRAGMLERAGAEVLRDDPGGEGIWPFFMVLMPDRDRRDRALGALWRSGAQGFKLFVRALPDYPYLVGAVEGGPCPAARDLAGRMLTVTNTHWLDDAAFAVLPGRYAMPDARHANLLEPGGVGGAVPAPPAAGLLPLPKRICPLEPISIC